MWITIGRYVNNSKLINFSTGLYTYCPWLSVIYKQVYPLFPQVKYGLVKQNFGDIHLSTE